MSFNKINQFKQIGINSRWASSPTHFIASHYFYCAKFDKCNFTVRFTGRCRTEERKKNNKKANNSNGFSVMRIIVYYTIVCLYAGHDVVWKFKSNYMFNNLFFRKILFHIMHSITEIETKYSKVENENSAIVSFCIRKMYEYSLTSSIFAETVCLLLLLLLLPLLIWLLLLKIYSAIECDSLKRLNCVTYICKSSRHERKNMNMRFNTSAFSFSIKRRFNEFLITEYVCARQAQKNYLSGCVCEEPAAHDAIKFELNDEKCAVCRLIWRTHCFFLCFFCFRFMPFMHINTITILY